MWEDLVRYLSSVNNREFIGAQLLQHIYLSLSPLLLGVLVAIPIGWLAHRFPRVKAVLLPAASILYTVPSLALFVVIPGIIGTLVLDSINVVVALTLYTGALLLRPVIDSLSAVPDHITAAATAMGYQPTRRFLAVELPLAVPVLAAGLRVGAVSNISLVSVGALIGTGGLGVLFTEGFRTRYLAPIVVGIALTLALALVVDLLLVALRRWLTPWERVEVGART